MRGKGKAACVTFSGGWLQAFPDGHVDVQKVHVIDNIAVEEGVFSGTQNGVLHSSTGDIPPTGHRVSIAYIQVLHFRDGKVLFIS